MEYYNPNDNSTKRYAAITTLVVLALFVIVACFISITVIPSEHSIVSAVVEVVAPPEDKTEEEKKPIENRPIGDVTAKDRQTVHQPKESPEPKSQASKGEDKVTENEQPQVNQKALFNADVVGSTATDAVSTGSNSKQGESDKDSGNSDGSDSEGDDSLSEGLLNRGLSTGISLPLPEGYNSNTEASVTVYFTADAAGNVIPTSVGVKLDNTTTTDEELRNAAMEAAKKAKFEPSDLPTNETIIYYFGTYI